MLRYRRQILISDAIFFLVFAAGAFFLIDKAIGNILDHTDRYLHLEDNQKQELCAALGEFKRRIVLFGCGFLLLYSLVTGAIIHRLSHPLQQIIDAILPYQEGDLLPRIALERSAIKGEFGKLATLLHSLTDRIQKQIERLKQQRKETEEILQSLGEGVVAVDISGNTTFANETACRMLGISLDAVLGQPLSCCGQLAAKCHEAIQQVLQTSEAVEQTWDNGQKGRIYLDLAAVPRIGQNGAILVIQDKTSDYKILEMGKDFIANASHELRTPITIIRGFAETLQDHPNLSSETLCEIAGKIVRTSGRLDKLIKGLLMLADIENLCVEKFQMIDLVALLEQSKHLLLASHPNAHLTFSSDLLRASVAADPLLLELAIMNLLENAVKYSPMPASIELSIHAAGSEARIEVRDQGIGIPEGDLSYVFDRFYTVDKARSRKSGGAGLGLSIVKTIVEKHDGKVTAASELGKGSTFTISLPLA